MFPTRFPTIGSVRTLRDMRMAGTPSRRHAPTTRRRAAAVVALVVLAGAGLPACRTIPGCDVALVGDSLSVGAAPYMGAAVASRGCQLAWVNARVSRTTAEGVRIIQAAAADGSLPRVVVVGLGTNDGGDPGAFAAQIDAVMAAAGPFRSVVWVDVAHVPVRDRLNLTLFLKDLQYPNLVGAPWNEAYWANPAWRAADGVHATAAGYAGRAEVTANSLWAVVPVA
jgi:hypothetical protein